jgi:hypothetical protein
MIFSSFGIPVLLRVHNFAGITAGFAAPIILYVIRPSTDRIDWRKGHATRPIADWGSFAGSRHILAYLFSGGSRRVPEMLRPGVAECNHPAEGVCNRFAAG